VDRDHGKERAMQYGVGQGRRPLADTPCRDADTASYVLSLKGLRPTEALY
jgi:hypothetical protein